jgi:PAS domain S-box-containing protein
MRAEAVRVLIVNDEPGLVLRARTALEGAGFDVADVQSSGEALRHLTRTTADLVILDLAHVDVPGLELLADLRDLAPDANLIVLSSSADRSDGIAALLAGADDCLLHPFSTAELLARIAALHRRRSRSTASTRLQEIVTGVTTEVADAVIIITPDHRIHSFNPAAEALYGWRADEVVGRPASDVLRWVGAEGDLQRARADLSSVGSWHGVARQYHRDGSTFKVRAATQVLRGDHDEPVGLISVNRLVERGPGADEERQVRALEAKIRAALAVGELRVHFQPIFRLRDRETVGVEALVRWQDGDVLRLPQDFIDVAERSDLIVEIGKVVLLAACRQLGTWRAAGRHLRLTVNISTRQLLDPHFVTDLQAVLAATGVARRTLSLEVTETALIEDVEAANRVLLQVADLGVGVTIDDFGTGWASLTYLQQLPITSLKIDRSFVAGLGDGRRDTAIVRSVLALGRELDMTVVAEGIETEEQLHLLQQLGCEYGQGYLVARPMPADQLVF